MDSNRIATSRVHSHDVNLGEAHTNRSASNNPLPLITSLALLLAVTVFGCGQKSSDAAASAEATTSSSATTSVQDPSAAADASAPAPASKADPLPSDWAEVDIEGQFTVKMPKPVEKKASQTTGEGGQVIAFDQFMAFQGDMLFTAAATPLVSTGVSANQRLDAARDASTKSGNALVNQKDLKLNEFDGRELRIVTPKSSELRQRLYVVRGHLLQVTAGGPKGKIDEALADAFFASIKLTGSPKVANTKVAKAKDPEPKKPTSVAMTESRRDASAYILGRKYAFACIFTAAGDAAKAKESHVEAATFAAILGLEMQPLPEKKEAIKALRAFTFPNAIKAKQGERAAWHYWLGVATADLYFGAVINADVAKPLRDVETALKESGIPEGIWKAKLATVKAKPTDANVQALSDAIETHYKSR